MEVFTFVESHCRTIVPLAKPAQQGLCIDRDVQTGGSLLATSTFGTHFEKEKGPG